jgi:branched-chain amino acid transport system ATP-binding protein
MVRTFQLTKVLARLTVVENMRLGAGGQVGERIWAGPFRWMWRSAEQDITVRAESLLARFKLDHMRDEFAGNLSGGQRKLLEMARALMTEPKLIMLDEPMAGVNPALKQSLLEHIKDLKGEGRTVLFVEHDMDVVHEISDWVMVMAEGQLIAEGTASAISGNQEVIDAYLGAHHEVDLGAMDQEEAIVELGLTAEELGLDQLQHLGTMDLDEELG